jgi:hypothetical protein
MSAKMRLQVVLSDSNCRTARNMLEIGNGLLDKNKKDDQEKKESLKSSL